MSATRQRLDVALAQRGLVASRSQAESYIRLGKVRVNGRLAGKTGQPVAASDTLSMAEDEQFVGRAALKLRSADQKLGLDFKGKTVLDIGSSTGGFTQYALSRGAKRVLAVEIGSQQLHPSLRSDPRIELHEKTDIREFKTDHKVDLALADVSFMSLRQILPATQRLLTPGGAVVAMVKPQFEAAEEGLKHKGVIKNDKIRREILKNFETWVSGHGWLIIAKADSEVAGAKGNVERFYWLQAIVKKR